jgi:flagellar protein FlaJ
MDNKFLLMIALGVIVVISFSVINFFFLSKIFSFSTILYVAIIFIVATPIFIVKYREQRNVKDIEESFPVFLRDFVEGVRSGMTIPQAFKSISNNDYRKLTPYVKKMTAQLDWGIPVETVLVKFSKETRSRLIGRIVSSVIEAHRFGGNLAETFEALSRTALEVERLRTERKLYMNSQMITGYIIFFVFLGVMIALGKFLVPTLGQVTLPGSEEIASQANIAQDYKQLFMTLILIQGFFAGLIVGKMAEGAMLSGIRHSFIMMIIGALVFVLFG